MQPVREHFCGVFTRHGADKTQPAFAEDALVRIRTQEALHQYREPGAFWFFPDRHFQRFVNLRQQRAPLAVGQKTGVAHHLKMPRRNVADIAPDHLFLTQRLAFMLSRAVIEVVVYHRSTGGRFRYRPRYFTLCQAPRVFFAKCTFQCRPYCAFR